MRGKGSQLKIIEALVALATEGYGATTFYLGEDLYAQVKAKYKGRITMLSEYRQPVGGGIMFLRDSQLPASAIIPVRTWQGE